MNERKFGLYAFVSHAGCAAIGAGLGLATGNVSVGFLDRRTRWHIHGLVDRRGRQR